MAGKNNTVSIKLSDEELAVLDQATGRVAMTRSDFVRETLMKACRVDPVLDGELRRLSDEVSSMREQIAALVGSFDRAVYVNVEEDKVEEYVEALAG